VMMMYFVLYQIKGENNMNYHLFEVVSLSGNREALIKVSKLYDLKDAYKVAYQNYSKKYYDISEGYFNGGYEVDEKRCTEVTWKVSYKWKNSGINWKQVNAQHGY
jgi:hypothetical protein